ncbi:MAG: hypothetical protein DMF77_17320 [Acidobacteria bacterium]|nr:MAG: hypothetical protein DMF77_17320 [Acidobacteriota bacterium]
MTSGVGGGQLFVPPVNPCVVFPAMLLRNVKERCTARGLSLVYAVQAFENPVLCSTVRSRIPVSRESRERNWKSRPVPPQFTELMSSSRLSRIRMRRVCRLGKLSSAARMLNPPPE